MSETGPEVDMSMDEFVFEPTPLDSMKVLDREEGVAEQVRVQVEGTPMAIGTFLVEALTTMESNRYNVTDPDQQDVLRRQRQHVIEMALEDGNLISSLKDTGITFNDIRVSARKAKDNDKALVLKFGNNGGTKPLRNEWLPGYKEAE